MAMNGCGKTGDNNRRYVFQWKPAFTLPCSAHKLAIPKEQGALWRIDADDVKGHGSIGNERNLRVGCQNIRKKLLPLLLSE